MTIHDPAAKTAVKTAVITGASAGIGAAAFRQLAKAGYRVIGGARRVERVAALAEEVGGDAHAVPLDVVDDASVEKFVGRVHEIAGGEVTLLVNNAGGALGLEPVADAVLEHWEWMYQSNVLGTLRMIRAFLPSLLASGDGQVINVGSIAGFETYPGGAGYTAAKHGLRALTRTLRKELLGQPVRVCEIAPGLVETEFSKVRFDGDEERAAQVYKGMTPLTADDVAECIVWAATRPAHVNIDEIVVRPRDQAGATLVHRRS